MRVDMGAPPPVDICEQADRLDRKLEQLLPCLAEHLADHETASTRATAENARKRPVDGAMGKGRLPPAPEGKRPLAGTGPSGERSDSGYFGARPSHAENIYHLPEKWMRSDTQCPTITSEESTP